MPWLRHRLRDADVWAKVDDSSALVKDPDGRVEIVYQPNPGARVYRGGSRNFAPGPAREPGEFVPGPAARARAVVRGGEPVASARGPAAERRPEPAPTRPKQAVTTGKSSQRAAPAN